MLAVTTSTSGADSSDSGSAAPGPRKRRLTLDPDTRDNGMGASTLLVVLDATRIEYDLMRPGGADLRFFDPEEQTPYPIEIDTWDPSGRSLVWVRVDASTLPEFLWMYYGDAQDAEPSDPAQVWDGAFEAVWHMRRTNEAGQFPDSSARGHDLQPLDFRGEWNIDGQIGVGARMESAPDGQPSGRLELGDSTALALADALTIEAWISPVVTERAGPQSLIRKPGVYDLLLRDSATDRITLQLRTADPGLHTVKTDTGAPFGEWTYVVATFRADDNSMALYRNGVVDGTGSVPGALDITDNPVQLGNGLDGIVDEVRVSSIERSPAWIELQYASMSDQLFTFGEPEPRD